MRVTNKETTKLVSVPKLTGKPMFINDNEKLTSVSKATPMGPDSVLINANGDMQKL